MCLLLPSLIRHLSSVFLLSCALLFPAGRPDPLKLYCPFTADYTTNSTFHSNLNAILSSLSSRGPLTGFSNDTTGAGPDTVYGLSLCRGDVDAEKCQDCLNTAVGDVRTGRCRYRKTPAVLYDECLLRYSERSFFSTVDTSPPLTIINPNNASEPEQFGRALAGLMGELTAAASYGGRGRMFDVGEERLNGTSRSLYGLVQCSRDLSGDQCSECLNGSVARLQECCGWMEGGRVFGLSCFSRFELFKFFQDSDAGGMPAPPPPPTGRAPPASPPTAQVSPPAASKKKNRRSIVVVIVVLPTLVALLVGISIYIWMNRRKTRAHSLEDIKTRHDESMSFDLRTLRIATNNFSYENKLGEGGFGPVYKGVLPNGDQIAIKKLSRSSPQGLEELRNEIVLVAKLQHRNLVRLLGYCLEEHANLLVYEYLPNKSLDKILFDLEKAKQLNWEKRYKIIEGIARGLLYLHQDSRLRVIHRDLKAGNILLDGEVNPKISDFGLAKLFGIEQSQGHASRIVGTFGYMAPEYVIHGHYSKKSDIYSFGIIILEIITGRQSTNFHGSGRAATLTSYVWQHWVEGTIIDMMDQSIVEGCSIEQVSRCIHIGLLCVQEDPYRRPSIASMLLMLSSDVIELPTVSEPAFCIVGSSTAGSYSSSIYQDFSS